MAAKIIGSKPAPKQEEKKESFKPKQVTSQQKPVVTPTPQPKATTPQQKQPTKPAGKK
ncbi:MAG: hypothetical protein PHP32_05900 [Candidatus Izemoplasmatales bacterium]|nr:hypothetical protein [Candidatus Izemoplasmatales bacterium]